MDLESLRSINPPYFDFLMLWQKIAFALIFASLGVALLIYVLYKIKVVGLKTYKQKYDHVSKFEISRYGMAHLAIAVSFFFFVNYLEFMTVAKNYGWFFVRLFIGIAIAILYGYIARLLLKYYWPGPMHKKLRKLRYTPRTNPSNGKKMKLLSEAEEDAYLDEGKQAEENVFSVDYDVWIDETTGETHIEKYDGRLTAEQCDRCGFQTLKLAKEEIVKEATDLEDGELLKEFKCAYCARVKRRSVRLTKNMKQDASQGVLIENPLDKHEQVVAVKVDISSDQYARLSYEFQSLREALRSEGLSGEGYGIRSIKIELFTNEDVHLKFEFQNLPEARKFMEQFSLHNVNN